METKDKLRKFRLGTSRAKTPMAMIYVIDPATQEIKPAAPTASSEGDTPYTSLAALADALPESTPRFVVLSHPLTLPSGRTAVPYVLLYYLPEACSTKARMSYAGAVELMRATAEVARVIECQDAEDVETVDRKLLGEE